MQVIIPLAYTLFELVPCSKLGLGSKLTFMLSLGKTHRLRQCATPDGKFVMLALDHRNNLQHAFNPENPKAVTYQQLADFKTELISALSPISSGVLLDPQYGAAASIACGAIHGSAGMLIAVEKTGYTGIPVARQSQILSGWSVEKISRLGAAGVKLLIYYHPDAPNADAQEALVREVSQECRKYDLPFFLEPLSFSLKPGVKKLSSDAKRAVVIETARRLTPLGVDILKAEFPLNIADEQDETIWVEVCEELSAASTVPWVLLSAGVNFDEFVRQTKIVCQAGASGVLAGRAVWKEAVELQGTDRIDFLRTIATQRMQQLSQVIDTYARPWTTFHPDLTANVSEGWYQNY